MLNIPALETERLVLRPWDPARDAPGVFAYASLPEATAYMCFNTHETLADSQAYLASCIASPEHAYAITLKGDDRPVGGCGITPVSSHRRAEIGYILRPDHWGKGYATELVERLLQYGFEDLGLNRIYARADTRNPASIRVMEKAGMSYEGTLREEMILRGDPVSFAVWSMLRTEWLARRRTGAESRAAADVI